MIEGAVYLFIALCMITTVLSIRYTSIVLTLVSSILWFCSGITALSVEIPYQYVNAGAVGTAVQTVESNWPLTYVGLIMGLVMGIYFIVMVLNTLARKYDSQFL